MWPTTNGQEGWRTHRASCPCSWQGRALGSGFGPDTPVSGSWWTSPSARSATQQRASTIAAAYSFIGPSAWNNIPFSVRHAQTLPSFQSQLKTQLFCLLLLTLPAVSSLPWSKSMCVSMCVCVRVRVHAHMYVCVYIRVGDCLMTNLSMLTVCVWLVIENKLICLCPGLIWERVFYDPTVTTT